VLKTDAYATVEKITAAEWINPSYDCRVLRRTLLVPNTIEPSSTAESRRR
jgi:hypothetical protein